jgi:hypothetical protein
MNHDEYEEHVLYSTGSGIALMPHHIMKFPSSFSIAQMQKPITLTRNEPKQDAEEMMGGTMVRSKKSKAFFLGREDRDVVLGGEEEITAGTLIAPIGSRYSDPDKAPWVLKDTSEPAQQYTGTLEGSQTSSYVLFVNAGSGFKVIPVVKWYKFAKKIETKILTLEEAEEQMKNRGKERWTRDGKAKSWKQKLIAVEEPKAEKGKSKAVDVEDMGMDYEFAMSDDEDLDFGLEDEEERKEAQRRVHSKAVAEHDEEEEKKATTGLEKVPCIEKKLAKSLAKRENHDVYDDYGPENPYWTDEEEEEEEKLQVVQNTQLEKVKKKKSPKPDGFKTKVSLLEEQPAKKQKTEGGSTPVSTATPPPPSAAQVVAREIEKEKKRKRAGSRGLSPSPAPSSPKTPPSVLEDDPSPMDSRSTHDRRRRDSRHQETRWPCHSQGYRVRFEILVPQRCRKEQTTNAGIDEKVFRAR